jgi:hypothetical protein
MFPEPFQHMDAQPLLDLLGFFFMAWIFFGIPSLLAVVGVSYPLMRFEICRFNFLKRPGFGFRTLSLPLCGLLFGMSTGYFAAWTERYDFETRQDSSWYDVAAIPGMPGDAMANSYGGDWQGDEAWDYRSDIAVWNGLFWMSVATGGMLLIRLIARRLPEGPQTPQKKYREKLIDSLFFNHREHKERKGCGCW